MNNLDYGVIGNCRSAAFISKYGNIEWLCFPDFDSPSVFAKLLDTEKGGSMDFIVNPSYQISQKYIKDTNILSTIFVSEEGSFEVIDFMPRYRNIDQKYYLPAEVYRYIRPISGKPKIRIKYNPVMDYGRQKVVHIHCENYIRTSAKEDKKDNMYMYSSFEYNDILDSNEIVLEKEEFILLSYNQKLVKIDITRIYLEYQRTKVYWLNWCNRSKRYEKYNDIINRSLLILKLMSFQQTGAVLAALTTSIPETIGEVRNWDYRFCWIRDASMSIDTLLKMGHQQAAKNFMGFIQRILKSKSDSFQIMYGIRGERILTEEVIPNLAGFQNSAPVRVGNAAYTQRQNDSLGYLLDVIYRYYMFFPGTLDEVEDIWEITKNIIRSVCMEWRFTDQSIWEFRNKEQHYVFSKVMCWVAIDRAVSIASILSQEEYAEAWREEANKIKEDVLQNGWNEELQSFTQYYGSHDVDSSLLLMEYYGFISADDPKFIKTVDRIYQELFHKGLMFRYKNEDDFGLPSSSFTICTFWLIRALFVTGKQEEAKKIFDELLTYSNHVGLFSEDLDFETKQQLGNFPQAYSHLALINTASLFSGEVVLSKFIRP